MWFGVISIILYLQSMGFNVPAWELEVDFDPIKAVAELRSPCRVGGAPSHSLVSNEILETGNDWNVEAQDWEAKLKSIPLRDPASFVSGQLHDEVENWDTILHQVDDEYSDLVGGWIRNKVDIFDFFRPFKGYYKGKYYESDIPPPIVFQNASNCESHGRAIALHLEEGLRNGSIELLGRVGEVELPRLVMPLLMIQGSRKQRLCHDERFLNLWMKHKVFSLEGLSSLPSILERGDFIAASDEKSAYLGIQLSNRSRTFFGIQFGGFVMQYTCLPFGWSVSPFIYQTTGMQVTSFLRLKGMITTQYLDDRFVGPLSGACGNKLEKTGIAIFYNTATLTFLGFTFEFSKSIWFPVLSLRHLGFFVHTDLKRFQIPADKKESFMKLREYILSESVVHVRVLQKFMGKCISLQICVPPAKLYIRVMAQKIGDALKSGSNITLDDILCEEIKFWRFLDQHNDWASWREEKHLVVRLATDASGFAWGASLGNEKIMYDMWTGDDKRPIHLKETEALLKALESIKPQIRDHRVDVRVDNKVLIQSWASQKCKDLEMVKLLKALFHLMVGLNCDLNLFYVSSEENPADAPSRTLSLADARLSVVAWARVEKLFGPHTFDLMALDTNAMCDVAGAPLPHFTPWPLPHSSGVNVLTKTLSEKENYYCFPPFSMTGALIAFLVHENPRPLSVTLVLPKLSPTPSWWPLVNKFGYVQLGGKGDCSIIEAPTKAGYKPFRLSCPLIVMRLRLE